MGAKQQSEVAGLNVIAAKVGKITPNDYNPNKMDDETFEKEIRSIKEHGFIDPITVRERADGACVGEAEYEIIDGEHRWRAAKQLGIDEIPVVNLGVVSDEKAKKLTILYNELKGRAQPDLLARVISDLAEFTPIADLAADLPYSAVEMSSLIDSLAPYEFTTDDDHLARIPDASPRGPSSASEQKVQIGRVHSNLPDWLVNELLGEWERSAAASRSRSMEVVMRDWVARLKASAPTVVVPQEAGAPVAAPSRAKKPKKVEPPPPVVGSEDGGTGT